ncbi:hypothetical protein AZZ71_004952, partial [Klebsiella pneumoniae]
RSTINSRSISARALMTWKKKRPAGVLVSICLLYTSRCILHSKVESNGFLKIY